VKTPHKFLLQRYQLRIVVEETLLLVAKSRFSPAGTTATNTYQYFSTILLFILYACHRRAVVILGDCLKDIIGISWALKHAWAGRRAKIQWYPSRYYFMIATMSR